MNKAPAPLQDLVARAVDALDYELVGVELLSRGQQGQLLRVYIDGPDGVGLDDCERVSHQVSGLLDVDDPIRGDYALEVSSPGLDRPLFELEHFARFIGQTVRIKLHAAENGRSNYRGVILAIEDGAVLVEVDGEPVRLAFQNMASARLVPTL